MDPCTFELLPGPPLSAFFSGCGNQPTAEFEDAYHRAIGALSLLPPVGFTSARVHHAAALHDSIELPATCKPYTAALDACPSHPAVEVPVTDSKNPATLPPHLSAEYDAEIDVNLREMEKNAKQRPSPDYLKTLQGDPMSECTRASLLFWMDEIAKHFDLAPGTYHRAVSYADRVLSERALPSLADMELDELQLLGAVAVYTAAKYEEQYTRFKVNAAGIARFCRIATSKEVIDMELKMLEELQYDLSGPTVYTFVEHFIRHNNGGEQELEAQRLAHELAEASLLDCRLLHYPPSALAASAVYLARLILNPKANQVRQWNKDFEELTGYKLADLIPGIQYLYMLKLNADPRFVVLPAFLQDE